jgi:hypothetical protein
MVVENFIISSAGIIVLFYDNLMLIKPQKFNVKCCNIKKQFFDFINSGNFSLILEVVNY